jgi:aminopeptidase YwaD
LLFISTTLFAQHLVPQRVFNTIANEYSGEAAQEYDRQIVQYHRIQGSPMMADVAEKVVLAKLKQWGIESKIEQFPSDGKIRYQTHISPMGWDMRGGELWVEGVAGYPNFAPFRLCRYSDVPMCVSTYSKGGDWTGELVEVGPGTTDNDYANKDLRGKVALAYGYAGTVVRQAALRHGAIGVVIYPPPGDRADHPDLVRYNGIWPRAEELDKTVGGFQISANQYTVLRELMRHGPVKVHGKIDATLESFKLTVVHAWIRGIKSPEKEILVTGHLDHPKWSANDNASGSAAMMESVRTLHSLIVAGKLPAPIVSIHFMWVPEFFGSMAYITKHPEARGCNAGWDDPRQTPPNKPYKAGDPCILFNLNLDMVGEDTVKTNSRFYITRTPDSVPGFMNAIMENVLQQTREASLFAPTGTRNYWPAEMASYMQGSDHDVFLGLGISSTMLGHDPDWTHHSSEDTVDKTDASEFRRVGVLASVAAYYGVTDASRNENNLWLRPSKLGTGEVIADRAKRIAETLAGPVSEANKERLRTDLEYMATMLNQQQHAAEQFLQEDQQPAPDTAFEVKIPPHANKKSAGVVPRRLTLLPIYEETFEHLSGDDLKWWNAQQTAFSREAPGGGLPTGPTLDLIVYEAINFMDGKRTNAEIARLLSAEYNRDLDATWMDQLVGVLGRLQLVGVK